MAGPRAMQELLALRIVLWRHIAAAAAHLIPAPVLCAVLCCAVPCCHAPAADGAGQDCAVHQRAGIPEAVWRLPGALPG